MKKTLKIAKREFISTVATKSFVAGLLIPPVLMCLFALIMPAIINEDAPRIEGELAIIDSTGQITDAVGTYLAPEAIAERRGTLVRAVEEHTPEQVRELAGESVSGDVLEETLARVLGEIPLIQVTEATRTLEEEKELLLAEPDETGGRLALAVIHDNALRRHEGEETFGRYDIFVRENLDDRVISEFKEALRDVITDARLVAHDLDPDEIGALTRLGRVRPVTVTDKGEQDTNEILTVLLPMGFMALLIISVMTGSAYLLTSTIEEKSNRVVEVLLSAVSPMQLMAGKILGQMAVGLVMLALYGGAAVAALAAFTLLGFIKPLLFVYLGVFFIIAYLTVGSFLAAVGAAATEMREAQSLQMPMVLMMIIPWVLWLPLSRDPNSALAVTLSLLPPISPMVMMLRVCSTAPPPVWQVLLAIVIGFASVLGMMWGAAKVFRVGLLLHGKAPNYRTMLRWIRMA